LPTGSGKTLIGLLIGEWRRRRFGERVVYLCPTNQLVHQVAEQARQKYGMRVAAFTGKKKDYDNAAKGEYLSGDVLAITSYSALFNSDPFFDDPNIIVLDDAHAAEGYIASTWSLRVERDRADHAPLFKALVNALSPALTPSDLQKLTMEAEDRWDASWVEKVPTPAIDERFDELVAVLSAHAGDSDLRYPWEFVHDHLHACHWYLGAREILIRPLTPPTNTHLPFAGAKQRIYMSATLGEGGELERITGRPGILRLPAPKGWDKQGIGRRFFMLPERSLRRTCSYELVAELTKLAKRALFLVPNGRTARDIVEWAKKRLGALVFEAKAIERSKSDFVNAEFAVAVVANRYDGIDFPEDECRLEIVEGLPRATNLQERFFVNRMGAGVLLNDRILTRVVQAFGRCTRDATDYAAVVILGEEMMGYLLRKEHRSFLHPELQAELEFGIEQSKETTRAEFLENAQLFLSRDNAWNEAESDIIDRRSTLVQEVLPGTAQLRSAVDYELEYQYALWQGDFTEALAACRRVLGELSAPELRGYRALWNYLAGSTAWLAYREGEAGLEQVARDYFRSAMAAASGIRWLVGLSKVAGVAEGTTTIANSRTLALIERLETRLEELGMAHDHRYAGEEALILKQLASDDPTKFEAGQEHLGRLLGFDAGNVESTGAPDPWWIVDDSLCIVFEDHSAAKPESSLGVTKARQVATHPNWVRDHLPVRPDAEIVPVLVTPVQVADRDALPHLKEVSLWKLSDFRDWATKALSMVRDLRRSYPGPADIAWRAQAIEAYDAFGLSADKLIQWLREHPADQELAAQATAPEETV
jgi:hypothetical protein